MRGVGFKFGIGVKFRHKVVIISVEPLGHFDGKLVFIAACQLEVLFQSQLLAVEAETGGNRAGGNLQVEDVVVESEVGRSHEIGIGSRLMFPVFLTQTFGRIQQLLFAQFFAPVFFLGELQFAECAYARET